MGLRERLLLPWGSSEPHSPPLEPGPAKEGAEATQTRRAGLEWDPHSPTHTTTLRTVMKVCTEYWS